jgi:hypothetical protein
LSITATARRSSSIREFAHLDFASRNLFRGTAYHNTIVVDGIEQNEIKPEWIFRMFEKANPEHLGFAEDGDWIEYRGRHHGYERLDRPVTHERSLRLNRATGLFLIEDRLSGAGEHDVKWHFHLAPGVQAKLSRDGVFELSTARGPVLLTIEPTIAGVEDLVLSVLWVRVPSRRLALVAGRRKTVHGARARPPEAGGSK